MSHNWVNRLTENRPDVEGGSFFEITGILQL